MFVGEIVGPFQIEKELGSGAMGTVFRAKVIKSGIVVALKVIAFGLTSNEGAMKRFEREASILKQLKHPHIVRLLATGTYRQTPFIAMEYVDGESLDHVQARRTQFTWEEVVEYGKQLCSALQHAHEKGIVHRDLKPSNLMITNAGVLKLTDFGIAKDTDVTALTAANSTIGTAAYMSPEQCRGEKTLGPKSDLYSFGVVLYELLTGRKPFVAESAVEMFMLHCNGKFERPSRLVMDIPVWLDNLICQLMEKRPEQRPMDAATVMRALEEITDKVAAQRSVGVDIATARAVDRPRMNNAVDQTDVGAAKSLRQAGRKKKTPKKKQATFWEAKWVQALGIISILVIGGLMVRSITRPERPEVLIAQIDEMANNGQREAVVVAVKDYLRMYGEMTDAETERMRNLEQSFAIGTREQVLLNRHRRKLAPEEGENEEAYELTMSALDHEADGDLLGAQQRWQKLKEVANKTSKPDDKIWGSLADHKMRTIQSVARLEKSLIERLKDDGIYERQRELSGEYEISAVLGIRYEQFGDPVRARTAWRKVQETAGGNIDQRMWLLLASRKIRELDEIIKARDAEKEPLKRYENLNTKLTMAKALRNDSNLARQRDARNISRDIIDLYNGDPDKKLAPLVTEADQLLKQMLKSS